MYDAGKLIVRTKPTWSPWLQIGIVIAAGVAYAALLADSPRDEQFAFLLAFASVFAPVIVISASGWQEQRVRVFADRRSLYVGRAKIARGALRRAFLRRRDGSTQIVVVPRLLHPVEIEIRDARSAAALLAALGMNDVPRQGRRRVLP